MRRWAARLALAAALFWCAPVLAQDLTLTGALSQGGLVTGQTQPGAEVRLDGRLVRVGADGRFLIGFGRDAADEAQLEVALPDGSVARRTLAIEQRSYDIQRIDGLPQEKVTPPEAVLARIAEERAMVAKVRKVDRPEPWFETGFIWPASGRISGVYGSQRILNGEPRWPHFGIDVAAPTGTPVVAPADGLVVLAHDDMYYSGGTVLIDHGHGLTSAYLHLSEILVAEGQMLRQGELFGRIGATGRVTGPHLDWRFNWFDRRLDPVLVAGPMPETQ